MLYIGIMFWGLCTSVQGQYVSKVWVADLGNGKYQNPVIHADYSDPDVCAVGEDYYMTASSFQCTPGLPILHSKDLVNWRLVNYALRTLVPEEFTDFHNMEKGFGHLPSVTITVNSTFIGVILILVSIW